nr:hypothetical protein [Desulfobacula sp.]
MRLRRQKLKPYEYHQVIMSKLTEENNVSVKVNNFVRSQAQAQMLRIADLTDDQVRVLWKQELEAGNVGPMMYAVVSREIPGWSCSAISTERSICWPMPI